MEGVKNGYWVIAFKYGLNECDSDLALSVNSSLVTSAL